MGSLVKALIIVDVQRDFIPGGALAVPHGNEVVAPILSMAHNFDLIVATQDYHPLNHSSFEGWGGTWPKHCVQGSVGAQLWPSVDELVHHVARKGMDRYTEEYSGARYVEEVLGDIDRYELTVCGLATEYCVKATAIDLADHGYDVIVELGACRHIDAEAAHMACLAMLAHGIAVEGRLSLTDPGNAR
jgi:nicotinamidase/pyrazinamidase